MVKDGDDLPWDPNPKYLAAHPPSRDLFDPQKLPFPEFSPTLRRINATMSSRRYSTVATIHRGVELVVWGYSTRMTINQLLPRKLTCPQKINGWKMYFLLKWSLFRGHVSFPGCKPSLRSLTDIFWTFLYNLLTPFLWEGWVFFFGFSILVSKRLLDRIFDLEMILLEK